MGKSPSQRMFGKFCLHGSLVSIRAELDVFWSGDDFLCREVDGH